MPRSNLTPTRSLPQQPNLTQLRKQAKDLLKSFTAAEPTAVAEVEHFETNPRSENFTLSDAQRVLARSYGFSSWTDLKQHVEGLPSELFLTAVKAGDVAKVKQIASTKPSLVNQKVDEFGGSALHHAVLSRDPDMTRVLMQFGADARKGIWPHRDATSARTIAQDRDYGDILAVIDQEEERRRHDLSSPGATIGSQTNEILSAIRQENCDLATHILEGDLSLIGACDIEGATPLHAAAWKHLPRMVQWLVDHGAEIDRVDLSSKTPMDYAAIAAGWSANDEFFPFIENAQTSPERFRETVHLLLSHGAELTPRAAVATGNRQVVKRMSHESSLTNDIHFYRGGLLAIAVRVNQIDMVTLLLDLGLDPDEPFPKSEDEGESWGFPLWFASVCGRHDIARLLLSRGADVNAIVYACGDSWCNAMHTNDHKMQQLLQSNGARLAVEHVASSRETVQAILNQQIPAHSLNVSNPTHADLVEQLLWSATRNADPEIVAMCLAHTRWIPTDPAWNHILLHCTSPECLQLILDHGAHPDVAKPGAPSVLHHIATVDILEQDRLALATLLLDAGASLERRDSLLMSTPLGWACRWGRTELAEMLLQRGSNAMESEAESWSRPLSWARRREHSLIVELLTSFGAE